MKFPHAPYSIDPVAWTVSAAELQGDALCATLVNGNALRAAIAACYAYVIHSGLLGASPDSVTVFIRIFTRLPHRLHCFASLSSGLPPHYQPVHGNYRSSAIWGRRRRMAENHPHQRLSTCLGGPVKMAGGRGPASRLCRGMGPNIADRGRDRSSSSGVGDAVSNVTITRYSGYNHSPSRKTRYIISSSPSLRQTEAPAAIVVEAPQLPNPFLAADAENNNGTLCLHKPGPSRENGKNLHPEQSAPVMVMPISR
ncbi:hypothetical protein HPB50_020085 [Hyalomma asiaticum]|uniref:Uncharacterized protein n=1 Tax=Hyalomma asiaticum TaxID=266040 RepID=A0ACB7SJL7_HYAAI|nr:hypothetical protein HPB50_020085 [Hyalomma asiaticum]